MKTCDRQQSRVRAGTQGFTITELLIVVVVIGILAALAAPSFNDLIKSQKIKSMASDLNASLTLARSEAIKRNANATITPTGAWQGGWQVTISDLNNPGANIVVETHSAVAGVTTTGPVDVVYRSSGRIVGTTAPAFTISAAGTTAQRCVSVDLSGRPYVKDGAC